MTSPFPQALWDLDLAPELFSLELGEVLAENAESALG